MVCEQPKLVAAQICMNQLGFYVAATSKTNCISRVVRRYVCLQLFKHVVETAGFTYFTCDHVDYYILEIYVL